MLFHFGQMGCPLLMYALWYPVWHRSGFGALPGAETKYVNLGKSNFLHGPASGKKIILGLAGKTYNHVGCQSGQVEPVADFMAAVDKLRSEKHTSELQSQPNP